ncbi:MAG TPA: RIO1 family regulatory kinase/ATPase [Candidatus Dormibacteraeota bacterium]
MLVVEQLKPALGEGWITQVVRSVKSGKEASVYLCRGSDRAGGALVAAKAYLSVSRRTFRDDSVYREGGMRAANRRLVVAATKRTRFGREVRFGGWIGHEFETLRALYAAGASVPRPIAVAGEALLLGWIGDSDGAAPPLHSVRLEGDEAAAVLAELLRQVELFLAHDIVHGDLSEYNVLFWEGRPVVIDFPQAVDPRFNRAAKALLERDLRNLAAYFARAGVDFDWQRHASDLWRRWLNSELGRDDAPAVEDWEFWKQFV